MLLFVCFAEMKLVYCMLLLVACLPDYEALSGAQ